MELDAALELLCRVHLREMETEIPTVIVGAVPDFIDRQSYSDAWVAVRGHVLETRVEDAPYVPNENTVSIPIEVWRMLNNGKPA